MTTARDKYWLLDHVIGWRISASPGLSFTRDDAGDVILDSLPGAAFSLDEALVSGIEWPAAIAVDASDRLFVLDAATQRITIVDLTVKIAHTIAGVGGAGDGPRLFKSARGLTVLPSGSVAVADTGNKRVQLFSASPWMLLRVWAVDQPVAVAHGRCGTIYVLDSASRTVRRFHPNGDSLDAVGAGELSSPIDLAVSRNGDVAVVDGSGDAAAIVVFPKNGGKSVHVKRVNAPACVSFDDGDNLFVGTADSLVAKLEPAPEEPDGYQLAGEGVTDVDGTVAKLVWTAGHGLVAVLKNPVTKAAPRLATINPASAYRITGQLETQPLDSGIEHCSWHRVQIVGTVPPGSSLLVESATSEVPTLGFDQTRQCTLAGGDNPDCLVQSPPGRYLRLRLTLRSSGAVSPRIHAIKVFFPRQSYLQYLPAVFQEDEESRRFLDRFLSIFQTSFDGVDRQIDELWLLFDPYSTPEKYLGWLAAWLALPLAPDMQLAKKRALLKNAFKRYLLRGTVRGLEQGIADDADVPDARVVEHYRLRDWPRVTLQPGHDGGAKLWPPLTLQAVLDGGARLWSRNFYARLQVGVSSQVGAFRLTASPEPAMEPFDWGANRFSVFFPAHPYRVDSVKAKVQQVVERDKPAHAQAILCPVFPRMRVGVQATLGVDAVVGTVNSMVLGRLSTLRYDSILACSRLERDARALGASTRPRVGVDAKVL